MSLIRYQPWGLPYRLPRNLDRAFANRGNTGSESAASWLPVVDIQEEDERFVLRLDVPGVDPGDIELSLDDGVLSLSGRRADEWRDQRETLRRAERVSGSFHRRFTLPDTADTEAVKASSRHGVLEVVIPKQTRSQPRRITVKAA